jgi:large subunit ribosomal protein L3
MGHRKIHGPKRGSLAYLPRGRAASLVGRIRYWPPVEEKPTILAFFGVKAGMTHVLATDNRKGSMTFGKEVVIPATVIETPPVTVVGVRAYTESPNGMKSLGEAWSSNLPNDLGRILTIPKKSSTEDHLKKIEDSLQKIVQIRVILATQPKLTKIGRKTPDVIEVKVGGSSIKECFDFAKNVLGKEMKFQDAFKEGQIVDVMAITKGKGIQGPVKRWGVRKLFHKSRKRVRGVGTLGAWTPHYVMYSVPRAGQMGFHQRTEYSKQVLKIGEKGVEITPKGGFIRYGIVGGGYVLLRGSVPGPLKRLVTVRRSARTSTLEGETPKFEYVSLGSRRLE